MDFSARDEARNRVARHLASRFGIGFARDRVRLLERAILRRMTAVGTEDPESYCRRIETDDDELSRLVDRVTNNLSRFFRNPEQLAAITDLLAYRARAASGSAGTDTVRVWVAGCSTGEEPYTLAMVLHGAFGDHTPIHITATDISRRALGTARSGSYRAAQARSLPVPLRDRYVETDRGSFRIGAAARERVTFRRHSLTDGPAIEHADLVVCRNVLTYLTREARRVAVRSARRALRDDGWLVIGRSESLPRGSGFVFAGSPALRIYRRTCLRDW